MSRLKRSGISDRQLIPLSFHVTYWDYIGWKDRFGKPQYDERQRKQAMLNASRTVYTPQFMLNGKDYRAHKSFDEDIQRINAEPASCQLQLTATTREDTITVKLSAVTQLDNIDKAVAYIVLYEHGLSSQVTAGENKGAGLRHDYVVRELKGPYVIEHEQAEFKTAFINNGYQLENSGIVAFVQKPLGSEILQAVNLELVQ